MRARVDGTWREGDALDLRGTGRTREAVRDAVRGARDWFDGPAPGPLWDHVGCVTPDTTLSTRAALAAAARSRGLTAPQEDERRDVLARREDLEVETVETEPLRRRLAEASADTDRLRETVARLQGRVQVAREGDGDGDGETDEEADLATAVRRLSERETDRAAARQALDRARVRRRTARDAREERRRLADRAANLARAARGHLVEGVEAEFRAAVDATPGHEGDPEGRGPFEADPVTRALAVARVGELRAPVVLDCDRFPSARAGADWLDAPVVRL